MHVFQLIKCVPIVFAEVFDKIRFVQKIRHAFSRKQKLQQRCISVFVHIFDTDVHVFVLLLFVGFGFFQRVGCPEYFPVQDFYLHFCGRDIFAQGKNVLVDSLEFTLQSRGLVLKLLDLIRSPGGKTGQYKGKGTEQSNASLYPVFFADSHKLIPFLTGFTVTECLLYYKLLY